MTAPQIHRQRCDGVGECGCQPDFEVRQMAESLDDLRQPETHAVVADEYAEVDEPEYPHTRLAQPREARMRNCPERSALRRQLAAQPVAFVVGQPRRLRRTIAQYH